MSKDACTEALDRLMQYLDQELEPADLERISEHLQFCPPCEAERQVEAKIRQMVARCGNDAAPAELKAKILQTIAAARQQK